jgi:hypothetical protein
MPVMILRGSYYEMGYQYGNIQSLSLSFLWPAQLQVDGITGAIVSFSDQSCLKRLDKIRDFLPR